MALSQQLLIRQSQALVMTPQLMQAIKLLQLSNLDLVAYVEAELERNPLLDNSAETETPGERNGTQSADDPPAAGGEPLSGQDNDAHNLGGEERRESPLDDTSPDDNEPLRPRGSDIPVGYSEWAGTGTGGRDDGDYNPEAFVSAETTLADWLREQMALAIADPVRRMIAQYLIDLVDEVRISRRRCRRGG